MARAAHGRAVPVHHPGGSDLGPRMGDCRVSETTTVEPTRRDMLYITTGAFAAVGVGAVAWPFIKPDESRRPTVALASTEVDISAIPEGGSRHREVARQAGVRPPPHAEGNRARPTRRRWPSCPTRRPTRRASRSRSGWSWSASAPISAACRSAAARSRGDYGGWFCPCHGSHYDTSGRIRKGPAPREPGRSRLRLPHRHERRASADAQAPTPHFARIARLKRHPHERTFDLRTPERNRPLDR